MVRNDIDIFIWISRFVCLQAHVRVCRRLCVSVHGHGHWPGPGPGCVWGGGVGDGVVWCVHVCACVHAHVWCMHAYFADYLT